MWRNESLKPQDYPKKWRKKTFPPRTLEKCPHQLGNSQYGAAPFWEFPIWCWPSSKKFQESAFFSGFSTILGQFLASNSYSFTWNEDFAKIMVQNGSAWNRSSNILLRPIWSQWLQVTTACCISWQIPIWKTQQGNLLGGLWLSHEENFLVTTNITWPDNNPRQCRQLQDFPFHSAEPPKLRQGCCNALQRNWGCVFM